MQELCKILGIKQRFHVSGYPQSSGQAEWSSQTLKDYFHKVVKASDKDWDQKLPIILMALRSTKTSHRYTPFEVLTGSKNVYPRTMVVWP